MNKEFYKLEIYFNKELVFLKQYEGVRVGLEFAIVINEKIELEVSKDTYVKVRILTRYVDFDNLLEYHPSGGKVTIKPQLITCKAGKEGGVLG